MQHARSQPAEEGGAFFEIDTEAGTIHVEVTNAAISLMRTIRSFAPRDRLVEVIHHHFQELQEWYSNSISEHADSMDIAIDRSGFLVKTGHIRFPARL